MEKLFAVKGFWLVWFNSWISTSSVNMKSSTQRRRSTMHVISQRGDYRVGLSGPIIYFYEHMRCRLFLSSHVSMIHDLERSRHVQSLALGFLLFECFLKGITYQGALSLHTVVNFASKIVASEINACAYYSCTHNLR